MEKILASVLVLIMFVGLVIPFEKSDAAPDVLFSSYASAGGSGSSTPKSFIAPCKVWVHTTITKAYAAGSQRVNPDKTFYPGDGFGYSFTYGITGSSGCQGPLPKCPVGFIQITGISSCGKSSASGNAEITPDWNASDHLIKLQVDAKRWECHLVKVKKGTKWVCGWRTISTVGQFTPSVIKPKTDVNIAQEYLNDADGYKSGNLDRTYYVWDAINIVHNPVYPWKNDRVGTLSVKVTKTHDLTLEKEYQCESKSCANTLFHKGFEPWFRVYEYGGGSTIYNSTQDDIRRHLLTYQVELFNLGRLVHKDENKTQLLVVTYDPVYEKYPYLVLKDEYWWSWGNRQGVALEYKGSNGGGQDDPPGLYEARRSKINRYDASGFALNPIETRKLGHVFSWDSASPIRTEQAKQCQNVTIDPSSFEAKKSTAMFVKSGYGKISFDWPITGTMLQKRYVNATIDNVLQSASFAGFGIKNLTEYRYVYPDVKFNNPVKILTYHSDGSVTDHPVSVKMVPDISRGAGYLQDYVCEKIVHDGYKKEIANIVVDDMYGRKNEGNGTGLLNLRTLLTSVWFPPFYRMLVDDTLDLHLNEIYAALSPFEITMSVGEKTRTINRLVNFLFPFVHIVNLDSDNVLNVTESLGFVRIIPDPKFGDIVKITVNGNELKQDCTDGCTTTIFANQNLQIEAWNVWGGRASNQLEKLQVIQSEEINWPIIYIGMFVAVTGFVAWKFSEQILEYVGFRNKN
ncbi:hypothetical protein DSQ19_03145 [Candidatus Nitrosotenuis sp. DW1]|nr:hypothetical protein DSQ19_03145 [Candidatus Nitrosotenuis sp. DW1]